VLKAALLQVLRVTRDPTHHRLARELAFVFADIPSPACIDTDLRRVRLDRGMEYYGPAIDWAKLLFRGLNPLGASGTTDAPTLLFPMEAVFECYVAAQLRRQLARGARLKVQAAGRHLVEHLGSQWFRLRPDAVISVDGVPQAVLDTKWKLINGHQNNAREKYGLREQDFYQLFAYGEHYLPDGGSLFLVYPKTPDFTAPLPPFRFQSGSQITLWVVPFQLDPPHLILPGDALESERIWSRTGCLAPGSAAQTNMCDVPRRGALFA
jgi:5-methylcytosine-specific restriction enzyme subunit McrC